MRKLIGLLLGYWLQGLQCKDWAMRGNLATVLIYKHEQRFWNPNISKTVLNPGLRDRRVIIV